MTDAELEILDKLFPPSQYIAKPRERFCPLKECLRAEHHQGPHMGYAFNKSTKNIVLSKFWDEEIDPARGL